MDEFELIRAYFDRASGEGSGVAVGIGDDGAVISVSPGKDVVEVIDTMVEGVHFPAGMSPADIGFRAVAINLSDIAAMGAVPRWMTLALSMPAASPEWLEGFAEGLFHAATEFGVALIGGDTTQAPQTVVSVQVTGEIEPGRALRRDGARVGDTVYVTGTLGDAAAGLQGLTDGQPVRELVARFARPSARVAYGQALVGVATAAIDVSDGLYADLRKLLSASGVGAEIDLAALPVSEALAGHFSDTQQRNLALGGGDDYELCFTAPVPPPDPGVMRVTAIGKVTENTDLVCRLGTEIVPFDDSGYRHFQ